MNRGQNKYDYFMERTEEDLKEIKADLRKLLLQHWYQRGIAVVVSALVSGVIVIFFGRG